MFLDELHSFQQATIDAVTQRTDIVEVLGQFLRLKKRGTNYIANCPFHNEKTPSFNVNPARGIFKCFGCGKGGNAVTFLQEHEKLSYPEAIKWLADYVPPPTVQPLPAYAIWCREGVAGNPGDRRPPPAEEEDPAPMKWLLNHRTDFGDNGWAQLCKADMKFGVMGGHHFR